jgi:hypothetical protein
MNSPYSKHYTPEELMNTPELDAYKFHITDEENALHLALASANMNLCAHINRWEQDSFLRPTLTTFLLVNLSEDNYFRTYLIKSFYDQNAHDQLTNKLKELNHPKIASQLEKELYDTSIMEQIWPLIKEHFIKETN